ncbi:pentatricopeptide repeat-containing protein At1g09190 [Ziziphus jujuba]|uniref:Pentatricopeptide repeat-containing protein At1g09190 n=1 Tax=Ziziphus jujuba TaxID=326968 RepID=A0A6P3ZIV2_ZIZJJ|nr:pentatricopeptide repeat-containing protein At1g09190 [Ziziphus jujuba]
MSWSCREVERRVLRLLHGQKTRTHLSQIHAYFLRHGLDQSNQVLSHFVCVCGSLGKMAYANRIYHHTQNPNILLFNSMIKGYSSCGPFHQSLQMFSLMRSRGIRPDEYTFVPLLKSCSNICEYRMGQCVHAQVFKAGFEWSGPIQNGIVEFYVTCVTLKDAKKMFDEMYHRDVIAWNLMIRGFCKMGDVDMGLYLFRQMIERSIVSWNSMISCLEKSGRDGEALELFGEMRDQGLELDEATVVTMLPVCARLGALDIGEWIHTYSDSKGLVKEFISIRNSLIDFYSKCGNLDLAFNIFHQMQCKNIVTWNAMISGLAFNGKGQLGVDLFEEMMKTGMNPNDATFVGVLACCAHAGLVEKGLDLFASITLNHQIEPKLEHYGCMVDILGRSGSLKEAHDLIRSMPMKPNATLWGSLLSSCRTYGDFELAELAVKELINLEPWNSGNYVLLSNIYAEEGSWDKVEEVRVLMREKYVKKAPGQSVVGIN